MKDIDKDTVDFRPTYDDSDLEPVIMPASFPHLLANDSEGVAVGKATNIPPQKLHELCDALIFFTDHPKPEINDIMNFIKCLDFPTGGIIIDKAELVIAAYTIGRGSLRVRSRWEKEELIYSTYQIVATEIPYQVQK